MTDTKDRIAQALEARFGTQLPLPADTAGLDSLARMLEHRSHRRYAARPVEDALLNLLFACAMSAPSKSDLQQADIVHVRDPALRAELAALVPDNPWVATAPVFLLMGDGAAGFSLMDLESLIRHRLPVVIIIGNNQGWALEKHPMRFLYGYDVIADLPATRFDLLAQNMGGGGELVTAARDIGPALDRAMAANIPYVVNIMTDPEATYPRSTTGI